MNIVSELSCDRRRRPDSIRRDVRHGDPAASGIGQTKTPPHCAAGSVEGLGPATWGRCGLPNTWGGTGDTTQQISVKARFISPRRSPRVASPAIRPSRPAGQTRSIGRCTLVGRPGWAVLWSSTRRMPLPPRRSALPGGGQQPPAAHTAGRSPNLRSLACPRLLPHAALDPAGSPRHHQW